jgi:hypothetical protein
VNTDGGRIGRRDPVGLALDANLAHERVAITIDVQIVGDDDVDLTHDDQHLDVRHTGAQLDARQVERDLAHKGDDPVEARQHPAALPGAVPHTGENALAVRDGLIGDHDRSDWHGGIAVRRWHGHITNIPAAEFPL